jgi:hypothetical protein
MLLLLVKSSLPTSLDFTFINSNQQRQQPDPLKLTPTASSGRLTSEAIDHPSHQFHHKPRSSDQPQQDVLIL